jgi:uncharacterized protein
MQYKSISADGHVNEPPMLWVENLPEKFRDRGPRVIETPNTKGHAWIMEGQKRPSVMGFSSMYFRSSKRFDRASLVEGFKQIKDRGVRYDDLFPGSWDPAERVKEIAEDDMDAEVIFNGVGTVWTGMKLCADKELALACYKVYNDWIADFQAYAPERFVCNGTLPTTGLDDAIAELYRCRELGLKTVQLESYPSGSFSDPSPDDDRFWAAAVELGMPINVHTQFFFPVGDLGSKITAEGVQGSRDRAKKMGVDVQAGSFPVILWRMTQSGVFERFPDLKFIGSEVHTGWVPYYLERFDDSVLRHRREWKLPRSSTPSTRSARTTATTSVLPTSCGALTSRTPRPPGQSTTSSAGRSSSGRERARARSLGSCGRTRPTSTTCRTTSPTRPRPRLERKIDVCHQRRHPHLG